MTSGARPNLMAPFLAAARSPRQPFTLGGTGTGSCRLPALVVDVDHAAKLTKPISAKALFGRAFSTTGVWLSFHVERWSL